MSDPEIPRVATAPGRFVANVSWSWLGMLANIAGGLLLTPYMVHRLGEQRYGLWSLVAVMEYFWLLDLGFRSATTNFVARHHAKSDQDGLNAVINTSLAYYTLVALVFLILTAIVAPFAPRYFEVPPALHTEFRYLVALTGLSLALGAFAVVFQASLEGMQRFDLTSRVTILTSVARVGGSALVLAMGHGTLALASVVIASQVTGYVLNVWFLQRVLKGLRFSRTLFSTQMLRSLSGYGVHTLLASASLQTIAQAPPIMIGHRMPVAFVGYYNVATRLLSATVSEIVARVGVVSAPKAAELAAHGDLAAAGRLTVYVNRYCLLLVLPACILLGVFGRDVLTLWIGPEVAARTMPILIPLLIGAGVIASQFNSTSVLFGLAGHQRFAKGLAVEAAVVVAAILAVAPRFGVQGIAWAVTVVGILNRGVFTSWLVSRRLDLAWRQFLADIYIRPLASGAFTFVCAWLLRSRLDARLSAIQLLGAVALLMILYAGLSLALCVPEAHRALMYRQIGRVRERLGGAG